MDLRRAVPWVLVLSALAYVALAAGPWRERTWRSRGARDFASFYYAVHAAADGADPYDDATLERLAREDGTRASVHPFFYPPPFLLAFAWVLPLSLRTAFRVWFVADHLFLLAVLLALWRWHPRPASAVFLAVAAVTFSPVADNDWMGQVNLFVLALVVVGLLAVERKRDVFGGVLLGTACLCKMSPALLVAWWLLHRRWRAVATAVVTGFVLSILSLPLVNLDLQREFYTEILPGFGAGRYHALTVPIALPTNHSIASLLHEVFPGTRTALSSTARLLSQVIALGLLGGTAWLFRRRPPDSLAALCQAGTVVVLLLVLPVYTYEHHMVWMLVPYAAAFAAAAEGRLGRAALVALVLAYAVQALPLDWLKATYRHLDGLGPARDPVYYALREAKFVAALWAGTAAAIAARRAYRPADRRA